MEGRLPSVTFCGPYTSDGRHVPGDLPGFVSQKAALQLPHGERGTAVITGEGSAGPMPSSFALSEKGARGRAKGGGDRKSTRLNSSH